VHTMVENSSGNTGFSLGVIARLFGIKNVKIIAPYDIAPGKREMLRLVDADVELCKAGGIAKAEELGKQEGFLNLQQYANPANPAGIKKWLAEEIWQQLRDYMTVFCAGMGTTGTIIGVSKLLRERSSRTFIVGVSLSPGSAVPGVRTEEKLKEISLDWEKEVDCRVEVDTKKSYKKSLELCRAGLIAGPSSGFALAGLIKFIERQKEIGGLDSLRNVRGLVTAVFICADTPFPYLDKYSTILDPTDF
jgi:cysteine synthase